MGQILTPITFGIGRFIWPIGYQLKDLGVLFQHHQGCKVSSLDEGDVAIYNLPVQLRKVTQINKGYFGLFLTPSS